MMNPLNIYLTQLSPKAHQQMETAQQLHKSPGKGVT